MTKLGLGKVMVLRKRADFVRVQHHGRRFRRQHLLLIVREGPEGSVAARIGYTVSRKVGNAVVRNRVRRKLREIVRQRGVDLRPGRDHVIIALTQAADAGYATLRDELTWLIQQARQASLDASS